MEPREEARVAAVTRQGVVEAEVMQVQGRLDLNIAML